MRIEVDAGAGPDQVDAVKAAIKRSHPMWRIEVTATYHIELLVCPSCRNWMLDPDLSDEIHFLSYEGQADIRRSSNYGRIEGKAVCVQCRDANWQVNFTCDHCDLTQPRSEVQFEYKRNGTGYLCKRCYNTLTAAEWDEAVADLKQSHSWSD